MPQTKGYDTVFRLSDNLSLFNSIINDSWHDNLPFFIARYLTNAVNGQDKRMTMAEVELFSQHNIHIVSIFQEKKIKTNSQGIITNYDSDQGVEDAEKAITAAANLCQPMGTPIYFAVETPLGTDPTTANAVIIHNYLLSVASILSSSLNNRNYLLGVYGPESTCKMIKDYWFSAAFSMYGKPYSYTFSEWTIRQDNNPSGYAGNLSGLVDFNVANSSNYGGWLYHSYPDGWTNYGNSARHRKKCIICNQYVYENHFPDATGMRCVKCGYTGIFSFPRQSNHENT